MRSETPGINRSVTRPRELMVSGPKRRETETPERLAVTREPNGPRNERRSWSRTSALHEDGRGDGGGRQGQRGHEPDTSQTVPPAAGNGGPVS